MTDDRKPLRLELSSGTPRRVWCNRCMVTEIEFDVLRLTDVGVGVFGIYRDCETAKGDRR